MDNTKPWVLIPTALKNHTYAHISKWRMRGYNTGLFIDRGSEMASSAQTADLLISTQYPGVWRAWNILAKAAVGLGAEVCVLAGDDMDPDPRLTGPEIMKEYKDHFPHLDGVMQPCGDPQGKDGSGVPAAARICGSPWVGKEWINYSYLFDGPVNANYQAFYADEELLHYVKRKDRLWMRPDLTQFHHHWSWGHLPRQDYHFRNQLLWQKDKDLFEQRQKAGFP